MSAWTERAVTPEEVEAIRARTPSPLDDFALILWTATPAPIRHLTRCPLDDE